MKQCPKCDCKVISDPKYKISEGILGTFAFPPKEWLEYTCKRCGYVSEGPTKDVDSGSNKAPIIKELKETHTQGFLSVDADIKSKLDCDFGIQIANDGRVWICIDGEAFIRFKPTIKLPRNKKS